jgi:tetratricopeptide (TPR) repeat protein
MSSLAKIWFELGRRDEAEKLYDEALAGMSRVLGKEHPDTLSTMKDVAEMDTREGRLDEADRLLDAVLKGRRRVLGENHPDTAAAMVSLADVAALRGDRAKSMDWLRQAVEHGYRSSDGLANDVELKSLRGDPAFETLVAQSAESGAK